MNATLNPPDSGLPARASIDIDRRAVLKSLAATGALAVPGLGLAACGGSSAPKPQQHLHPRSRRAERCGSR